MIGRRPATSDALGRGMSLWAQHLPLVAAISAPLAVVGVLLLAFAAGALRMGGAFETGDGLFLALVTAWVVVSSAAIATVIDDALDARVPTLRHTARRVVARLPSALVAGLIAALPLCAVWLAFAPALALGDELRLEESLIVMLVLLVGVPLASWLFVPLSLAPQAALVDGLGPLAALRRSWALTRGERMAIFGLLIVASLVLASLAFVVVLLVSSLDLGSEMRGIIASIVLLFVASGMLGAMAATVHHELRVRTEGTGIESLREIFR